MESKSSSNTSINLLPDSILGKIFRKCPSGDLNKLGTVCPKWNYTIENYCGTVKVISSYDEVELVEMKEPLSRLSVWISYSKYYDKLLPKEEESRDVNNNDEIQENTLDVDMEEISSTHHLPIPTIKVSKSIPDTSLEILLKKAVNPPDTIRRLSLIGPIPIQLTGGILNLSKNLNYLHLHFTCLNGIRIEEAPFLIMDIPTLKSLVVESIGISEGSCTNMKALDPCSFLEFYTMYAVLSAILNQNHFPHLKLFVLDVPYCPERENSFITAVGSFLSDHYETLEKFCYHQGFIVRVNTPKKDDDKIDEDVDMDQDEEFVVDDSHVSMTKLAENAIRLKKVFNLKDIHINLASQQESDPLWKNFILHQKQMERFIFTGESRINFPSNTLRDNGKTLTTIILDVRDDVDLEPLNVCDKLKKLVLMAERKKKNQEEEDEELDLEFDEDPNLRNVNKLPKSLEIMIFRYLKIKSQDVDLITLSGEFPKLKEFELKECGNEKDLGVSIRTLAKIWEEKKLSLFIMKRSLNKASLKEKPLPENVNILVICLNGNLVPSKFNFEIKLNPNGEYEWDCPDDLDKLSKSIFDFPDDLRENYNDGHQIYLDPNYVDEIEDEEESESEFTSLSGSTENGSDASEGNSFSEEI